MTRRTWHYPPSPSSKPEGSCTTFGKLSKTVSWVLHFSAIMAQLFFSPLFWECFPTLKTTGRFLGPAGKISCAAKSFCWGESPFFFCEIWECLVPVNFSFFFLQFWPFQTRTLPLPILGATEPSWLWVALTRLFKGWFCPTVDPRP